MAINDTELAQWIDHEIASAGGYSGGELAQLRTDALNRYYMRPIGNESPGRSQSQSNDVADMVEALVAQMLPGLTGDSVIEFEPETAGETESAQAESDVVNNVIIEDNRGFVVFQSALRNALLLRNGWCKVWLETDKQVSEERVGPVDELVLGQLMMMQLPPGVTRESVNVREDSDGLVSFTIRDTTTKQRLKVSSVDPVNMRWTADWDSIFVQDIPFLAEQWFPTRS